MSHYYSSRSIPTTQHSSLPSRIQVGQLQSERSQGRYTTSHRRDDSGYRSSRYETEDEDSSGAEAHTYSTRRSEHRRIRSTGSGSYGGSISQLPTESPDREHDMRYYNYSSPEEGSPTGTSHGHGRRRSELEGRYTYSERIPAPTSERQRARVMQPAPRITVSEYDGLEYGYTYPASSSVRHESQRYSEQYPRQTSAPQDPYRSRTSSQYYSPSVSNSQYQPSAGGTYPLRRVPSNQSDRYSASPPSPTTYPEGVQAQPVQVNRYGRVPLWYEEREAFTRYSS